MSDLDGVTSACTQVLSDTPTEVLERTFPARVLRLRESRSKIAGQQSRATTSPR